MGAYCRNNNNNKIIIRSETEMRVKTRDRIQPVDLKQYRYTNKTATFTIVHLPYNRSRVCGIAIRAYFSNHLRAHIIIILLLCTATIKYIIIGRGVFIYTTGKG